MRVTVYDDGPIRHISKSGAQNLYRSLWYEYRANGRELHRLSAPREITIRDSAPATEVDLPYSELPWLRLEQAKTSNWRKLHNPDIMHLLYVSIQCSSRPRRRAFDTLSQLTSK